MGVIFMLAAASTAADIFRRAGFMCPGKKHWALHYPKRKKTRVPPGAIYRENSEDGPRAGRWEICY